MKQVDLLIEVAQSQLGYHEESNGWTKYGQWYQDNVAKVAGFSTADWCNMFVTWCMNEVGAMNGVIYPNTSPQGSACPYCLKWFEQRNRRTGANDMPQKGDLVFYRWNPGTTYYDHIGIVASVSGYNADNAVMTVIEGNKGDEVATRTISYRNQQVQATVRPAYSTADIPEEVEDPADYPEIYKGHGETKYVTILQEQLNSLGYECEVDGIFGSATETVVKEFQADNGLKVDGIVGIATWAALFDEDTPHKDAGIPEYNYSIKAPYEMSINTSAKPREGVQLLQMALLMHGYDVGSGGMDGIFGAAVKSAVVKFQQDHDLEADGVVGTATWQFLTGIK